MFRNKEAKYTLYTPFRYAGPPPPFVRTCQPMFSLSGNNRFQSGGYRAVKETPSSKCCRDNDILILETSLPPPPYNRMRNVGSVGKEKNGKKKKN